MGCESKRRTLILKLDKIVRELPVIDLVRLLEIARALEKSGGGTNGKQ